MIFKFNMKPESLNNCYSNSSSGRFKNSKYKRFEKEFNAQLILHSVKFDKLLKEFKLDNNTIFIHYYFFFPYSEIVTQKGVIKKRRWDLCNLTKIPNDLLSNYIGIDDALFVEGDIAKHISPDDSFKFFIDISIHTFKEWEAGGIYMNKALERIILNQDGK